VEKYGYDPTRTRPMVAYSPTPTHTLNHYQRRHSNDAQSSLRMHNGAVGGSNDSNTNEEKKTTEEPWSTLSCYGNTEVSILMLHDNNKRNSSSNHPPISNNNKTTLGNISSIDEVAGISPDCTLGITLQDVGTHNNDDGADSLMTLRLGPIEISVGNHYDFPQQHHHQQDESNKKDMEDDDDDRDTKHDPTFAAAGVLSPESLSSSFSSSPLLQSRRQKQQQQAVVDNNNNGNNNNKNLHSKSTNDDDEENMEEIPFEKKLLHTMYQTATSMKSNAIFVVYNKDFPDKVIASGTKITDNFGKTLDNTMKFGYNLFTKVWGGSSGDDDDN